MFKYIIFLFFIFIVSWGASFYAKEKQKNDIRKKNKQLQKERENRNRLQIQKINFVKSNSKCIQAIINFNRNWNFIKFSANPCYKISCKSKQQFDNFNFKNFILLSIEDSPEFFENMVSNAKNNKLRYKQYEQQYSKLLRENLIKHSQLKYINSPFVSEIEFQNIELEESENLKLQPDIDFTITCIIYYSSPQGNNHYEQHNELSGIDIEHYLHEYKKIQKNKQSATYQRSLVTPKLRYEIMKRDGFRCVRCGCSKEDGVKLHVDHIKPVSKGGKTEKSNLRTLCNLCNLGKGASYDPYGLN